MFLAEKEWSQYRIWKNYYILFPAFQQELGGSFWSGFKNSFWSSCLQYNVGISGNNELPVMLSIQAGTAWLALNEAEYFYYWRVGPVTSNILSSFKCGISSVDGW